MYKLCFYVPESHLQLVKSALFAIGAGHYDQCCWQVLGESQFRPLANSQAFIGEIDQLQIVPEYKVEMICSDELIKPALQTLLANHPYQQPAYDVSKILTAEDF
jgi:hypothetical protein